MRGENGRPADYDPDKVVINDKNYRRGRNTGGVAGKGNGGGYSDIEDFNPDGIRPPDPPFYKK